MTEKPVLTNPVYKGDKCRACNAELVFLLTPKGRREPLERATTPYSDSLDVRIVPSAARIVAIVNGQPQSLSLAAVEKLGLTIPLGSPVHVAHFATCPSRDRFRR